MGFQSSVNVNLAFGLVGELFTDGPFRAAPWTLNTTDHPEYNVVGRAFTVVTADPANGSASGIAAAGGTGVFAGLFANPKVEALRGTTGGTLEASLAVPNYTIAELVTMGTIIVAVPSAAKIGDVLTFNQTTGVIGTVSPQFSGTGAITTAVGVDTLTITAQASGNTGKLGVGSIVTGPNIAAGTFIKSLGTGTGGTGTYILSSSGQTAASGAVVADTVAPSGHSLIAGSKIVRYDATGAGVAVATLT